MLTLVVVCLRDVHLMLEVHTPSLVNPLNFLGLFAKVQLLVDLLITAMASQL